MSDRDLLVEALTRMVDYYMPTSIELSRDTWHEVSVNLFIGENEVIYLEGATVREVEK